MAYKVQLHEQEAMVEVNNIGLMNPDLFREEAAEVMALLTQKGWYRVLVHTELQRNSVSATFLQQMPWMLSTIGFPENGRIAVIKGSNSMVNLNVDLFQEICLDYDFSVASFSDDRAARDWLLSG